MFFDMLPMKVDILYDSKVIDILDPIPDSPYLRNKISKLSFFVRNPVPSKLTLNKKKVEPESPRHRALEKLLNLDLRIREICKVECM